MARRQTCRSAAGTILDTTTAFVANLAREDRRVDLAKPAVVSKILTLTGVHGHLTAALLSEMQDVRGSASVEELRD